MALAATFEIVQEKREEDEEENERATERADRAKAGNAAAADAEEDTHMLAAGAAAGAAAAQSADPASSDSAGASSGKSSATATDWSASAAAAGSSRSTLPPLRGTADRARAQLLVALGSLALASNRHGDAAETFVTAQGELDAWCWSAWAGLCDAGGSVPPPAGSLDADADILADPATAAARRPPAWTSVRAFDIERLTAHRAVDFLPPDLERRIKHVLLAPLPEAVPAPDPDEHAAVASGAPGSSATVAAGAGKIGLARTISGMGARAGAALTSR